MSNWRYYFVVGSALLVLAGIVTILAGLAYGGRGHPPASGIIAMIVIILTSPPAIAASILGTIKPPDPDRTRSYYIATGICLAFTLAVLAGFVFKVVLGRPL